MTHRRHPAIEIVQTIIMLPVALISWAISSLITG